MSETQSGRARLAQWIERSKLNQRQAAALIGLDETYLSQVLGGKRRPGLDNAIKIEQATGIVVEAWLPLDDDTEPEGTPALARKSKAGKA